MPTWLTVVLTSLFLLKATCVERKQEATEFCTLDSFAQRTRVPSALAMDVTPGRFRQTEEWWTSRRFAPGGPLQPPLTMQNMEQRQQHKQQASDAIRTMDLRPAVAGSGAQGQVLNHTKAASYTGAKHRALHAVSLALILITDSMIPPRKAVNQVAGAFGLGSPFSDEWATSAPQQLHSGIVSFAEQFPARQVCAFGIACLGLAVAAAGLCCLWEPRKGMRSGSKLGGWGIHDPEPVSALNVENPECAQLLMLMPVMWGHVHGVC